MLRSTGIAGFHGIMPQQGNIIRPMLFTTRGEIEEFIKHNGLQYREDKSNQEVKYLRNKIRHELMPVLAEINPGYKNILTENIFRVREAEKIFRESVDNVRNRILRMEKGRIVISIREIKKLNPCTTYLFEFLSSFGFNFSVVSDIVKALDEDPGKQFFSSTHRLIKDRQDLIITPLDEKRKVSGKKTEYQIDENKMRIRTPLKLSFKRMIREPDFQVDTSPSVANLDLRKISFPLILRKWQPGDSFYPFGRGHKKKLSDFFTDHKFSIDLKENTWLLCSGGKIIWVVGHRIDNRFRITPRTKQVLQIRLLK
jgi:tRNA(Ile)-lysidine synthase